MSNFEIDGDIQINGRKHTVQYEPSAMVGGATLFLKVKNGNKNVPIFYNEIDEVVQMLRKGKLMISALEGESLIEPEDFHKLKNIKAGEL